MIFKLKHLYPGCTFELGYIYDTNLDKLYTEEYLLEFPDIWVPYLFTTYDNFAVFKGDVTWSYNIETKQLDTFPCTYLGDSENLLYFSTESAMKEYVNAKGYEKIIVNTVDLSIEISINLKNHDTYAQIFRRDVYREIQTALAKFNIKI